jgi:hypothetical protein
MMKKDSQNVFFRTFATGINEIRIKSYVENEEKVLFVVSSDAGMYRHGTELSAPSEGHPHRAD